MTDTNSDTEQIKLPPHPSQAAIRNAIAPHAGDIVRTLLHLMHNADNDSVKVGAAKTLLAKIVPDLKSSDFQGEGVKSIVGLLNIIAERNQTV
jgi:hypothetical protein